MRTNVHVIQYSIHNEFSYFRQNFIYELTHYQKQIFQFFTYFKLQLILFELSNNYFVKIYIYINRINNNIKKKFKKSQRNDFFFISIIALLYLVEQQKFIEQIGFRIKLIWTPVFYYNEYCVKILIQCQLQLELSISRITLKDIANFSISNFLFKNVHTRKKGPS